MASMSGLQAARAVARAKVNNQSRAGLRETLQGSAASTNNRNYRAFQDLQSEPQLWRLVRLDDQWLHV